MTKPNEFRRVLPVHDLPQAGRPFEIEAGAEDCRALAQRFDIPEVLQVRLAGLVRPEAGGERLRLRARLDARVVQRCVVTLQPVDVAVSAEVDRLYGTDVEDEWAEEAAETELFVDIDDDAFAEPLPDGMLDVGEVAAEQLALELDPFPRAPGADLNSADLTTAAPERPLATLLQARLNGRKDA